MALKFHPNPGTILFCNFETGFVVPEMVKSRPVVVVSPRLKRRDQLCCVVPLSTSEPTVVCDYHYRLPMPDPLPEPWDAEVMWVKADMLATVSFERLNLIRTGRDQHGKRKYVQKQLPKEHIAAIKIAVLCGLGMSALTEYIGS